MKRILIVSAHPDDEILGCGATILKHINDGDEVFSLVLGEGITARYENQFEADRQELQKLNESLKSVAKELGIQKYWHFGYPDNRFDSVSFLEIVKSVERVKNEICPSVIYTHFCNDLSIDHKITFNAVLTACRPVKDEPVKEIYSFETPSSTEWIYGPKNSFTPNMFVNVDKTMDKKIKTLELYNEMRKYPHPRSLESVRVFAKKNGIIIGCNYAEAFEIIRVII